MFIIEMHCIVMAVIASLITATAGHPIEIVGTQPHNSDCYSQGLFFLNSTHLFQTCGLYNQSYFHILKYEADPFSISEVFSSEVPWRRSVFLEGAILFNDFIYLLTWREFVVYRLHPLTFETVEQIPWGKEGWGLTHNGTHMFTTDGSDRIFVVDKDFQQVGQQAITTQMGRRLRNINELQYVDGYLYANIYLDSKIVKIDYAKGKVVEQYDGTQLIRTELAKTKLRSDEVINGIAYDTNSGNFLLTGKHWGTIYKVSM